LGVLADVFHVASFKLERIADDRVESYTITIFCRINGRITTAVCLIVDRRGRDEAEHRLTAHSSPLRAKKVTSSCGHIRHINFR